MNDPSKSSELAHFGGTRMKPPPGVTMMRCASANDASASSIIAMPRHRFLSVDGETGNMALSTRRDEVGRWLDLRSAHRRAERRADDDALPVARQAADVGHELR